TGGTGLPGARQEPNVTKRRVVITGTGLITALGTGTEATWEGLLAGRSGVGPITRFDAGDLGTRIAAEVKDFNAEDFIDRKEARRMDRFSQFAVAAAEMAVKQAGLPIGGDAKGAYDPERVGVVVGSGIGGISSLEEQ